MSGVKKTGSILGISVDRKRLNWIALWYEFPFFPFMYGICDMAMAKMVHKTIILCADVYVWHSCPFVAFIDNPKKSPLMGLDLREVHHTLSN